MTHFPEEFDFDIELLNQQPKISETSKRHYKFHTETLPSELRRLEQTIKAFSKVKLNDKGLPW